MADAEVPPTIRPVNRQLVISVDHPSVVLRSHSDGCKIQDTDITSIISHRTSDYQFEQYLVRWNVPRLKDSQKPHSWHDLDELSKCLTKVQRYLNRFYSNKLQLVSRNAVVEEDEASEPYQRSLNYSDVINGLMIRQDGVIKAQPVSQNPDEYQLPTSVMELRAIRSDTRRAFFDIRNAFDKKLCNVPVSLEIINQLDGSRPPLDFEFIDTSRLGRGVQVLPGDTIVGCGAIRSKAGRSGVALICSPNMGQQVGCEYSRVCECLEYAAVDETRIKTQEDRDLFLMGETRTLPKRFPYHTWTGLLTEHYLDRRNCIYECNPRCKCGPGCRTRLVQKGRTVPLQIFKTSNKGWSLRCKEDLQKGQFIDTYRGEIITNSEADRREQASSVSGLKVSYLYSLDKHVGQDLREEDCYVVDGEFMGGPTRFINHSCDPNVRQYTVSYNKHDYKVYELAFFASRHIPAMEELAFDYMDREDDDIGNDSDSDLEILDEALDTLRAVSSSQKEHMGTTRLDCLCGSSNCRKVLWM